MFQRQMRALAVLLLGFATAPAFAQQTGHEQHHPAGMPTAAEPDEAAPGGGMTGMGACGWAGRDRMAVLAGPVDRPLKTALVAIFGSRNDTVPA